MSILSDLFENYLTWQSCSCCIHRYYKIWYWKYLNIFHAQMLSMLRVTMKYHNWNNFLNVIKLLHFFILFILNNCIIFNLVFWKILLIFTNIFFLFIYFQWQKILQTIFLNPSKIWNGLINISVMTRFC